MSAKGKKTTVADVRAPAPDVAQPSASPRVSPLTLARDIISHREICLGPIHKYSLPNGEEVLYISVLDKTKGKPFFLPCNFTNLCEPVPKNAKYPGASLVFVDKDFTDSWKTIGNILSGELSERKEIAAYKHLDIIYKGIFEWEDEFRNRVDIPFLKKQGKIAQTTESRAITPDKEGPLRYGKCNERIPAFMSIKSMIIFTLVITKNCANLKAELGKFTVCGIDDKARAKHAESLQSVPELTSEDYGDFE